MRGELLKLVGTESVTTPSLRDLIKSNAKCSGGRYDRFKLTGHSLGGGMSSIAGALMQFLGDDLDDDHVAGGSSAETESAKNKIDADYWKGLSAKTLSWSERGETEEAGSVSLFFLNRLARAVLDKPTLDASTYPLLQNLALEAPPIFVKRSLVTAVNYWREASGLEWPGWWGVRMRDSWRCHQVDTATLKQAIVETPNIIQRRMSETSSVNTSTGFDIVSRLLNSSDSTLLTNIVIAPML